MQRLEITGETPEALYINVINTLSLFLRGPQTTAAAPVEPLSSAAAARDSSEVVPAQTVDPEPAAGGTSAPKPKRGARAKVDKTELNDDISDVGTAKTIEHDANEVVGAKTYTLDGDIKPRLQAIQKAHAERGNDMPACVAYLLKLYGPFGIKHCKELKPEQFAEFMEASEGYLSGEA